MASLFTNELLPATSEEAIREFNEKYLAVISAAPAPTWADRFVIGVGAPRVTFPISLMSTFSDFADHVHGPNADWGHLSCGCHPNCGVGMAVMVDKETREAVPVTAFLNAEQLAKDIASVSVEDAYRYSINVENTNEYMSATNGGGDFNTGVLNTRSANRIRGLSSPGVTHDFFQTVVLQDTYNTERVDISRGANAILFGLGSPAGIINNQLKSANLSKDTYNFQQSFGRFDSHREVLDINQIPNGNLSGTNPPALEVRPIVPFRATPYWAMGVSAGLEFRY